MQSQPLIDESRLTHIRELKTAVSKLKAENARLRDENAELNAHLDFAILAARDLESLVGDGKLVIVDGWNRILSATRIAKSREDLVAQAEEHLATHPNDLVWIVYDGPRASTTVNGRLRVSYTGGVGEHRADKFICDFLRMAKFRGTTARIEVKTDDKDFLKDIKRISA